MNFNFTAEPEYSLNTTLTTELINLYGVLTKFLIAERINKDDNVFGDYSHLKTDNTKIYDIYMLPEMSEDWDAGDLSLSNFGLVNFENISLFVPRSAFDGIIDINNITGNIVVLPNNKIMEITDTDLVVPGINNMFTNADAKSVFKLTCKPHDVKIINEMEPLDITAEDGVPYESLDSYFAELVDHAVAQETEIEVTPQSTAVDTSGTFDVQVEKPIVDKTETSVWGEFD